MVRRSLFAAPLAVLTARAAGAQPGVPPDGTLTFDVHRKGSVIGAHALSFDQQGDALLVKIDLHITVGFGPVVFYRYRHTGVERHRDGRFVALQTQTDNNGEALRVSAVRDGEQVVIESSKLGRVTLPGTALPLTHWNPACMTGPVFNPQDGKPMRLTVARQDGVRVALSDGRQVAATCFSMTGDAEISDWYDAGDVWTALRAPAKDGTIVTYRRLV